MIKMFLISFCLVYDVYDIHIKTEQLIKKKLQTNDIHLNKV
jgi:hypothetical protein